MLVRCAALSSHIATAFAMSPTIATTSISPPATSTSLGFSSRWMPSIATQTDRAMRITPFTSAPNTSARWNPNVRRSFAGRAATTLAMSAITRAAASVNMCAASASSASDPDSAAPTICTTMTTAVIASEIAEQPAIAGAADAGRVVVHAFRLRPRGGRRAPLRASRE